jgi:hypothetical protein
MPMLAHPRPLAPTERDLPDFLLSAALVGRDELASQADLVEVVGECDCGCGTVDLQVNGVPRPEGVDQLMVEANGKGVDVLLFARGGFLSSLEIVDHGDSRPLPYPRVGELTLWLAPRPRSQPEPAHKGSRTR